MGVSVQGQVNIADTLKHRRGPPEAHWSFENFWYLTLAHHFCTSLHSVRTLLLCRPARSWICQCTLGTPAAAPCSTALARTMRLAPSSHLTPQAGPQPVKAFICFENEGNITLYNALCLSVACYQLHGCEVPSHGMRHNCLKRRTLVLCAILSGTVSQYALIAYAIYLCSRLLRCV